MQDKCVTYMYLLLEIIAFIIIINIVAYQIPV